MSVALYPRLVKCMCGRLAVRSQNASGKSEKWHNQWSVHKKMGTISAGVPATRL